MKRTIKTLLISALCICMLLAATPNLGSPVFAAEIVYSGYCGGEGDGTNLTWTLDSDGLLTISGTGEMEDNPWPWSAREAIERDTKIVLIESGIFNISDWAFENFSNLTNITIPDSVTNIGFRAFYGCKSLTNIAIPNNVTNVGEEAFGSCDSLISVTIGDNVTSIEGNPFLSKSLTEITVSERNSSFSSDENGVLFNKTKTKIIQYPIGKKAFDYSIPDSVTDIGACAFYGCESLRTVTFPNNIKTIESRAFEFCNNLISVSIPESVTHIGYCAFGFCTELTSVTIPNNIKYIEESVFENCTKLTAITIPDSVTGIGAYAFRACTSLTSVTIPDSVMSIGKSAFSLTTWFENQPDGLVYAGKVAYKYKGSIPRDSTVTLKDGTFGIASFAFGNCTNLTSIIIPDSVTSIGADAFYNCKGLTGVYITDLAAWCGIAFADYNTSNPLNHAHDLYINGVLAENVAIPNSVTSINNYTFEDCTSLTSVTIPDGVMRIGGWAFEGCTSLTDVYYMGSEAQWKQIEIADGNDPLLNATIHYHTHTPGQQTETILKAPTCVEDGKKKLTVTCTVCGAVISETIETIPATGLHTFGDWIVKVPATVDAEGEETRTCSVCGATESRAIPKQEKPDEPVPTIDTDTLQESDGAVYAAPEQTVAALLTAAGKGATLTNADGSPTAPDAILSSGMVLVKPDGTKKTVIVKGDNDGDGRITASDARTALRAAVELETPNAWQKDASLVADGTEITAADARLILRAAVGLETLKLR